MTSVLQSWVMELPLREQGTLVAAVRGCDVQTKDPSAPAKHVVAALRCAFMNPADPREVDMPGAFFRSDPPESIKASAFDHLPLHWFSHLLHAIEVVAYRHPDVPTRQRWLRLYDQLVDGLHLWPEERGEMIRRLSADRIADGTVVS
jgi:hypothetical protein